MNDFQSDYTFATSPACALPDLRYLAYAAGVVVVVLAIIIVAVNRLRPW